MKRYTNHRFPDGINAAAVRAAAELVKLQEKGIEPKCENYEDAFRAVVRLNPKIRIATLRSKCAVNAKDGRGVWAVREAVAKCIGEGYTDENCVPRMGYRVAQVVRGFEKLAAEGKKNYVRLVDAYDDILPYIPGLNKCLFYAFLTGADKEHFSQACQDAARPVFVDGFFEADYAGKFAMQTAVRVEKVLKAVAELDEIFPWRISLAKELAKTGIYTERGILNKTSPSYLHYNSALGAAIESKVKRER